jgi:hypothetical protein
LQGLFREGERPREPKLNQHRTNTVPRISHNWRFSEYPGHFGCGVMSSSFRWRADRVA